MIRYLFNQSLLSFKNRYDYDISYMQDILQHDLSAFLKFIGLQMMSNHSAGLAAEPIFAARLQAILWDDCGPCTQLIVNLALEAKVESHIVRAIVAGDLDTLPEPTALVVRFTRLVLAHDPEADGLREQIIHRWGRKGLIAIGYAISSSRVYPALKYTLGYGNACSCIQVQETQIVPNITTVKTATPIK
ncbi:hypothetical protein QWY82_01570 [Simiduia curdlanivorans]|uniref:Uncharacterized protein n=1 Tax=Simiduia curdlanivorans TaxID=1492769 RepID=A0ABV8V1C3_9GAMM|nr:hypothetical protein [Simiduia curdlanivorans]MDN3637485.1 hypothetical protein [Simiduia curdlanivorans]